MGREKNNMNVVKKALSRLSANKDRIVEAGMRDLLEDAMLFALGEHDATHWFHTTTENSYGWCLLHDGEGVAYRVNEGRHGGGDAYEQLMSASRDVPQTGWVGILLASFRVGDDKPKPRMFYFNLDYEMTVFAETTDNVEEQFHRFFKPLV